jgi:hypothetical protein
MYLYKKEMYNQFKWKFPALENIETSYSQLLQDMWVLAMHDGQSDGTFLEVGGDHPFFINNTWLLESEFNWTGMTVDFSPASQNAFANSGRKTRFVFGDALTLNYVSLLKDVGVTERLSYASIDIEPNINTLHCLETLLDTGIRFSCLTFETDYYDTNSPKEQNEYVRSHSRKILEDNGYVLVAGNVCNKTTQFIMEDWWADAQYFKKDWIDRFLRDSDDPIPAHVYCGLE